MKSIDWAYFQTKLFVTQKQFYLLILIILKRILIKKNVNHCTGKEYLIKDKTSLHLKEWSTCDIIGHCTVYFSIWFALVRWYNSTTKRHVLQWSRVNMCPWFCLFYCDLLRPILVVAIYDIPQILLFSHALHLALICL